MDNKVSEKAIWEGSITPDNDTPSFASQLQTQPQMMFCYNCNNVIPANSKFCPCCNIELYTTCPKCGQKYSSQYPICNQCGTNRQEYLQLQKKEQERKAAIERENRRQREIQERNRLEEERKRKEKEAVEAARRSAIEREEREKDYRARMEAFSIKREIEKKCSDVPFKIWFIPIIILTILSIFGSLYFIAIDIGWIIIGGIWMNIKIRIDIEKEIQEWRNNHPGDRRGRFLSD